MDFDDLDEIEASAGPTPEERCEQMVSEAMPEEQTFPFPEGKNFGKNGKMKMLFLHGGGTNTKIANLQISNVFKDVPDSKDVLEWTVWTGPHSVPLGWNGDFSLKMFGPEFSVYFERLPFANCQWETWEGIEKSFADFASFLKENGPFDGVCGFDMGGEFLVQVAKKAQEGDPAFKGIFRFMILFTTGSSKHLSPMCKDRPKAQLRTPAILSWPNKDETHTYMWYEETTLFFHKDFREVLVHQSGHMPPRFSKGMVELARLTKFLEAMKEGKKWAPSEHEDNTWGANLFFPMKRIVKEKLPSDMPKRLIVVTDPMGAHDFEERIKQLEEAKKAGLIVEFAGKPFEVSGPVPKIVEGMQLKLEVCTLTSDKFSEKAGPSMQIHSLEYTDEQKNFNWHCLPKDIPQPQQLNPEDIIDKESHDKLKQNWADSLLRNLSFSTEDAVGIVGLGTGAFIALAVAKLLIRDRKVFPAGLWVVNPPTRLPWSTTMSPGILGDCNVKTMCYENASYGPTWRYEVLTCGAFSHAIYKDIDQLVSIVIDDFNAM